MSTVNLSPQQRQVLDLAASGKTNLQIGDELGISIASVRDHVRGINRALGVQNPDGRETMLPAAKAAGLIR